MKKISTATAHAIRKVESQRLTIGLDLGDRSSWYCVLDETGEVLLEQKLGTIPKTMRAVFGEMPRSRIIRDRDAFTLGEPVVERVGARSDRGACAQSAFDRRESSQGRSTGCENLGPAGKNRPATAGPGEAS